MTSFFTTSSNFIPTNGIQRLQRRIADEVECLLRKNPNLDSVTAHIVIAKRYHIAPCYAINNPYARVLEDLPLRSEGLQYSDHEDERSDFDAFDDEYSYFDRRQGLPPDIPRSMDVPVHTHNANQTNRRDRRPLVPPTFDPHPRHAFQHHPLPNVHLREAELPEDFMDDVIEGKNMMEEDEIFENINEASKQDQRCQIIEDTKVQFSSSDHKNDEVGRHPSQKQGQRPPAIIEETKPGPCPSDHKNDEAERHPSQKPSRRPPTIIEDTKPGPCSSDHKNDDNRIPPSKKARQGTKKRGGPTGPPAPRLETTPLSYKLQSPVSVGTGCEKKISMDSLPSIVSESDPRSSFSVDQARDRWKAYSKQRQTTEILIDSLPSFPSESDLRPSVSVDQARDRWKAYSKQKQTTEISIDSRASIVSESDPWAYPKPKQPKRRKV